MRDRRKEDCKGFGKEFKEARVANLRKMKSRQSPLPNLKAKLWATRILDEINNDTIPLPGSPKAASKAGNIQEDNDESLYIIGTDVESLLRL